MTNHNNDSGSVTADPHGDDQPKTYSAGRNWLITVPVAVLLLLAWGYARSTIYTLTSARLASALASRSAART